MDQPINFSSTEFKNLIYKIFNLNKAKYSEHELDLIKLTLIAASDVLSDYNLLLPPLLEELHESKPPVAYMIQTLIQQRQAANLSLTDYGQAQQSSNS